MSGCYSSLGSVEEIVEVAHRDIFTGGSCLEKDLERSFW